MRPSARLRQLTGMKPAPPDSATAGFDQAEETMQRSLFGEILDWMLVPLLLLWPISIAITYVVAKNIANQPFDRALDDRVTVLAQQVKEINGQLTVPL
ncbi:MAG: sensor histidine kinase N-terminal domain-containing protein, partial [Burkholderiaceae bacterium]